MAYRSNPATPKVVLELNDCYCFPKTLIAYCKIHGNRMYWTYLRPTKHPAFEGEDDGGNGDDDGGGESCYAFVVDRSLDTLLLFSQSDWRIDELRRERMDDESEGMLTLKGSTGGVNTGGGCCVGCACCTPLLCSSFNWGIWNDFQISIFSFSDTLKLRWVKR